MNRKVLIIVALLVLGIGAWAFISFTGNDNDTGSANDSSQEQIDNNNGTNPAFSALGIDDQAFEAVITGSQDGEAYKITMQSDGEGRMRMFGQGSDGADFETVYTPDAYYSCAAGECVKFPVSQGETSAFTPSDYVYDDSELGQLSDNASYVGKRDCPAGQCDAWEVTEDGNTSTLYLDSGGRISQVTSSTDEGEVKIVYTFKAVSIKVPANAQEIPTLQP